MPGSNRTEWVSSDSVLISPLSLPSSESAMLHAAVDVSTLRIRIQSFRFRKLSFDYSNSAGEPPVAARPLPLSRRTHGGQKSTPPTKPKPEAGFVDTLEGRLYTSSPEATNRFPPVTGPLALLSDGTFHPHDGAVPPGEEGIPPCARFFQARRFLRNVFR